MGRRTGEEIFFGVARVPRRCFDGEARGRGGRAARTPRGGIRRVRSRCTRGPRLRVGIPSERRLARVHGARCRSLCRTRIYDVSAFTASLELGPIGYAVPLQEPQVLHELVVGSEPASRPARLHRIRRLLRAHPLRHDHVRGASNAAPGSRPRPRCVTVVASFVADDATPPGRARARKSQASFRLVMSAPFVARA